MPIGCLSGDYLYWIFFYISRLRGPSLSAWRGKIVCSLKPFGTMLFVLFEWFQKALDGVSLMPGGASLLNGFAPDRCISSVRHKLSRLTKFSAMTFSFKSNVSTVTCAVTNKMENFFWNHILVNWEKQFQFTSLPLYSGSVKCGSWDGIWNQIHLLVLNFYPERVHRVSIFHDKARSNR